MPHDATAPPDGDPRPQWGPAPVVPPSTSVAPAAAAPPGAPAATADGETAPGLLGPPDRAPAPSPWATPGSGDSDIAPTPGRWRHPVRALVLAIVVVALLLGGGIALLVTSGPSTTPSTAPAARSLQRTALASAGRVRSFHYVSRYVSGRTTETTVGDAGPTSGRQIITIGSDTFTVLVIGSACYFKGDAREMADQLGLSPATASAHADQWISLAPGDTPYQSVSVAVTAGSALTSNITFRATRESGRTTVAGHKVIGITGPMSNSTVNGQLQQAKGTASLYAAAARPHLPARYTQRGTVAGERGTFVMDFSKWGEAVTFEAPAGAVPFSTLGGGTFTPNPEGPVLT